MSDVNLQWKTDLKTLNIANGGVNSDGCKVAGFAKGTLELPGALTGTLFTVQHSSDGGTWKNLQDAAGNAITLVVAPNLAVGLPAACFGSPWIRFVSNGAEAAARILTVTF